jgi:signal transduction histidine kinase
MEFGRGVRYLILYVFFGLQVHCLVAQSNTLISWESRSRQLSLQEKENYLNNLSKDSLLLFLSQSTNQHFKIDLYNALADQNRMRDTDKALEYLQKAFNLNKDETYFFGVYRSNRIKAICSLIKSQYGEARKYANISLKIAQKNQYYYGETSAFATLANIYGYEGNSIKALENHLAAIKVGEEHQLWDALLMDYFSLAMFYDVQENYPKAEKYFKKARTITPKIKDKSAIFYYSNIYGLNLKEQKKYKEAVLCLTQNIQNIQENEYPKKQVDLSITYHSLGMVYSSMYQENPTDSTLFKKAMKYLGMTENMQITRNKFVIPETLCEIALLQSTANNDEIASQYYSNALENALIRKNNLRIIQTLNKWTNFLIRKGEYTQAQSKAMEAFTLSRKIGTVREKKDVTRLLSIIYAKLNQYQKAYEFEVAFKIISDSLYSESTAQSLLQAELEYEFEAKQKVLRFEMQSKEVKNKEAIIYQTRLRNVFLGVAVILLVLIYWTYRLYKDKQKSYNLLDTQKSDLENANLKASRQKRVIEKAYKKIAANHEVLQRINIELKEKNEEIETQAEELREAHEEVKITNSSLEQVIEERTANLSKAYDQVAKINSELDNFLYRSSHDLRRPLTTLMGLHNLAQMVIKEETAKSLFEKVNITAMNMDKMLAKFLMIHDINYFEEASDSIDFEYVIDVIKKKLAPFTEKYQVDWQIKLVTGLETVSDTQLIIYILQNLVENSILCAQPYEKSYVQIDIHQEHNELVMIVSDNGVGIDANYYDQIFDMFFRANESSQGNGLGLYVVQKAIEQLNGSIRFESEVGKGSTFWVRIPIKDK